MAGIAEHKILGKFLTFANGYTGILERNTVAKLGDGDTVVRNRNDHAFKFSARTEDQKQDNNRVRREFLKGLADYLGVSATEDEKLTTKDILRQIQKSLGFNIGRILLHTGDFEGNKGKPLSAYRIRVICENAESFMKNRVDVVYANAISFPVNLIDEVKDLFKKGPHQSNLFFSNKHNKRDLDWLTNLFVATYHSCYKMTNLSKVKDEEFKLLAEEVKERARLETGETLDETLRTIVDHDKKTYAVNKNQDRLRLRRAIVNALSTSGELGDQLYGGDDARMIFAEVVNLKVIAAMTKATGLDALSSKLWRFISGAFDALSVLDYATFKKRLVELIEKAAEILSKNPGKDEQPVGPTVQMFKPLHDALANVKDVLVPLGDGRSSTFEAFYLGILREHAGGNALCRALLADAEVKMRGKQPKGNEDIHKGSYINEININI